MSFYCSANLRAALNASPDKLNWASTVASYLGNTRRIRCKRDANANATDPWATGTEFRNVGSTGALTLSSGTITGLGQIKGTTISLAADVFSGALVMRIESSDGTNWIQGTLGPTIAAQTAANVASPIQYDFEVDGNFTTVNGFAVKSSIVIGGPRFLPSGTGPAVPAMPTDAPHSYELWDWSNSSSPALVGVAYTDTRDDDFVMEHPQLAQRMGDVGWYRANTGVTWGNFEMAPHLFLSHAGNTEDGSGPLCENYFSFRYHGAWTSYPGSDTYDKKNMVLNLPPFKVVIKDAAGNVLTTIQMQDGKPINDPSLKQAKLVSGSYAAGTQVIDGRSSTDPLRPAFNCAMGLVWRNKQPKFNDYSQHLYPGLTTESARPSRGHAHFTVTSTEPLVTGGYGGNSMNNLGDIYCTDKWPRPRAIWNPPVPDPYGNYYEFNTDGHSAAFSPWVEGWGYEPGSYSTHNWYSAPGGPRHDRCFIPSTLAWYITNPNGIRPQDNTPWKDMATDFIKAYANHSNKFVKSPTTLYLDTKDNMLYNWKERGFYYSNGSEPATPQTIQVNGNQREGSNDDNYDVAGNMIFNGWARDYLHNYANAGWGALAQQSPMMAVLSRFDTFWSFVVHGQPEAIDAVGDFGVRIFAWNVLHHVMAWIVASKHQLGFSRSDIEERFGRLMTKVYNDITVPLNAGVVNNGIDGIRRLGQAIVHSDNGPQVGMHGGNLGFYMAGVLTLMKQSGMWDVMKAKGGAIQGGMEQILHSYDQYAFGQMVHTRGSGSNGGYWYWPDNHIFAATGTVVPGSWADLSALNEPNDLSDLVHNGDGTVCNDRDVSQHQFTQWIFMRRDFFPEYTHPDMAQAITNATNYLQVTADHVAAQTDNISKRDADCTFGYVGISPYKAPAVVGAL